MCTGRSHASSRELKIATNCKQEGKTVFTPMLNQIDQSDASFSSGNSLFKQVMYWLFILIPVDFDHVKTLQVIFMKSTAHQQKMGP